MARADQWRMENSQVAEAQQDVWILFYHSPAWMLIFACFFSLVFIMRPPGSAQHRYLARLLWLPVSAFLYYTLFYTGSRQTILGGLVVSGVLFGLMFRLRISTVIGAGLAAIAVAGALMYIVDTDVDRMRFAMLDEGVGFRWRDYEGMLRCFDSSPLFGRGLYYDVSCRGHNIFLDALAGQGVPGLLFLTGFLSLSISFARGTVWRHRQTESQMWRLAAVGIFAVQFWCSQVSMGVLSMNTVVWSLLAIWRLNEFESREEDPQDAEQTDLARLETPGWRPRQRGGPISEPQPR
jgi:hypothetical protein